MVRRFSLGLATVLTATAATVSCSIPDGDTDQRAAATDSAVSPNVASSARRDSAVKRRLRQAVGVTYINEMFEDRDQQTVVRWEVDEQRLLGVFLPRGPQVPGFRAEFTGAIRHAFDKWETSGLPLRFDLTADSADADIHIVWIEQFDIDRTGEALVQWRGPEGWITGATLTLALRDPGSHQLNVDQVHVVALHEIGHVMGLGHSPDHDDVMYAETRARDFSGRDRQTARLLYQLPPGRIP